MEDLGTVAERVHDEFYRRKDIDETDRKLYRGEKLEEKEVEHFLGESMWKIYEYVHNSTIGQQRKCGNSAISHMFEVAVRAHDLGFSYVYSVTGLLHDSLETKCKQLKDIRGHIEEIGGVIERDEIRDEVLRDVVKITNPYSLLIECIERRTSGTPATGYTQDLLRVTLDTIRDNAGEGISTEFKEQFNILYRVIRELDISEVNDKITKNPNYSVAEELKARTYGLYIADIFADARERYKGSEERYDVVVIVKGMDNIDNLRTMGLDKPVMEKTLGKTETFLRYAEEFKNFLSARGEENKGFLTVYDALKDQLIEQLLERKNVLGGLSDTRYIPIREYVEAKIKEYSEKYQIDVKPIAKRIKKNSKTNSWRRLMKGVMKKYHYLVVQYRKIYK
jgi:hypothetical protein